MRKCGSVGEALVTAFAGQQCPLEPRTTRGQAVARGAGIGLVGGLALRWLVGSAFPGTKWIEVGGWRLETATFIPPAAPLGVRVKLPF